MTDPEQSSKQVFPSAERITAETGCVLRGSYNKDALGDPIIRRSYMEQVDSLRKTIGEDRVVTSFYYNPDGELRWGVFARLAYEQQASTSQYPAKTDFARGGQLATQDTAEIHYPKMQPGGEDGALPGTPPPQAAS